MTADLIGRDHRVDRLLSFFSSRPNWNYPPPPPHTQAPPPLVPGEGGGVGVPVSDELTDTCGTLGINVLSSLSIFSNFL
jgi:hypothetical protein